MIFNNSHSKTVITGFFLWLAVVAGCALWLGLKLKGSHPFDTNIIGLLPAGDSSVGASLAQQRLADLSDKRLIFLVKDKDKQRSAEAASVLLQGLRLSESFAKVNTQVSKEVLQQWRSFYYPHRHFLLSARDRKRLLDNDTSLVDEGLAHLFSPIGSLMGSTFVEDPFHFFFRWQTETLPSQAFIVEQGMLTRKLGDYYYRLVSAELVTSPYDASYQEQVMKAIRSLELQLPQETELLSTGLIYHAAYGAEQAKREISTIGVGSILGIALLLFFCFRRVHALVLALVPITVGCGLALTVSLLVFERVHLVTLTFGAVLVGVSIDYSLHYLCVACKLRDQFEANSGQSTKVLRRILPSLSLGLMSSVLAYTAQGMAPFPGLQQMALFSAVGLIAAWLTVVLWMPVLQPVSTSVPSPVLVKKLDRILAQWPKANTVGFKVILVLLSGALLWVVSGIEVNNDLRLLRTSTLELLERDAEVQEILDGPNPGQYFVVDAENQEQLLEIEEHFIEALHEAVDKGWIENFTSISQYVPSRHRQEHNHRLLSDKVYKPSGLLEGLLEKGGLMALQSEVKSNFSNTPNNALSLSSWLESDVSRMASHLWVGEAEGRYYSMIALYGLSQGQAMDSLRKMAESYEGITFIDRVEEISQLLKDYGEQLRYWLLAAYCVVILLLLARYRRDCWRIIAAPALASLVAITVLHLSGSPITLFHGLALLLILGIGLDASIFLYDSLGSVYTWLAVSLSSFTTLLAFGLLALSGTPVLHFFGVTVLLGIICVWALAPCFTIYQQDREKLTGVRNFGYG